jgi:glucosamine-6-phosphate isomerase
LNITILKDYEDMSLNAAELIIDRINKKPSSIVSLASGNSPIGIYRHLVKAINEGRVNFGQTTFVCLDEIVGMGKDDQGSASYSLFKEFFNPAQIHRDQIHLFDTLAKNLDQECLKINQLISKNGGLDLVLLGIGLNGHLGFNEPGVSFDLYAHVIDLDDTTKKGLKKYFNQSPASATQGITLGIKHILEAKTAIVVASGESKREVVQKMIHGSVTNQCPCTVLQLHPNAFAFVDVASYSKETIPTSS